MLATGVPPITLLGCPKDTQHVGVVFVHGIGSQAQGEILHDWGGAIAHVLFDFRVDADQNGDPVVQSQLDLDSGLPLFVELQVTAPDPPGVEPPIHLVLTEAWWAHEITPPSFGQMAQWLGPDGAVPRIVKTILPRDSTDDPRARPASKEPDGTPLPEEHRTFETAAERMQRFRRRPGSVLGRAFNAVGAWVYLQALSALLLLLYGTLRSVESLLPIGPLADGALTRPIDRFVLDWFGDVFVLLSEPTQASSVRHRLSEAIRQLKTAGCDEIVVIAHSGGAIVAWTTLVAEGVPGSDVNADAGQDMDGGPLDVHSLITIGEGLNLAWNITSGDTSGHSGGESDPVEQARHRFQLLYEPLAAAQPRLDWIDYWGSRDPAPTGPVDAPAADLFLPPERFTNMAIWNLLSSSQDHGAYWDNDEEFVIPLLRRLEGIGRSSDTPSFFGSTGAHELRSNWRRRRVSVLSLWKQLCLMAPTAAVITSFAIGNGVIPAIGDALATAWSAIPGSDLITKPVDYIRDLNLQDFGPTDTLAEVGVWVVAALIASVAWFALIAPTERSAPWVGAERLSTRVIGFLVGSGPLLAATPLAIGIGIAAVRFIGGATPAGDAAVVSVLPWILIAIGIGIVVAVLTKRYPNRWATLRIFATAIVLFLSSYVILAPLAAILIFPAVGQMVLGTVGVILGFGIVARIGTWRWTAWDTRDRRIGHARDPVYPTVRLVAMQAIIFLASLGLLYVAVGFAFWVAAVLAVVLLLVAVFVGIAIDVNQQPTSHRRRTPFENFVATGKR